MGVLSDRLGRGKVIFTLSAVSAACSFVFGWTLYWNLSVVITVGLVYAFSALGDSPVLSAGLTEVVKPSYMGAAFGLRSLIGFGVGALSPIAFGAILDWTNPAGSGPVQYTNWGWAFGVFGLGGLGAALTALAFGRRIK
jgi:MFS family permease